jgi:hypothetical protein
VEVCQKIETTVKEKLPTEENLQFETSEFSIAIGRAHTAGENGEN